VALVACAVEEEVAAVFGSYEKPTSRPWDHRQRWELNLVCIGVGHVVRAGYACAAHRPHYGGGDGSDRPAHWCAALRACVLYSVRRPSDVLHAFAYDICLVCSPPTTRATYTINNNIILLLRFFSHGRTANSFCFSSFFINI